MARTLEVGGNQGRGNPSRKPSQLVRLPAPDDLAFAVAEHIRQATPGLPQVLTHPAWLEVARWRVRRLTAMARLRMALLDPWSA